MLDRRRWGRGPRTVDGVTDTAHTIGAQEAPASILVVDDHEEIVHLLAMLLAAHGYTVVGAYSVAEAIERYGAGAPPMLVITDVDLADGNGADLIARLGHPMTRTLFTSGHPRAALDRTSAALPAEASFLQKPSSPAVLLAAVREILATDR